MFIRKLMSRITNTSGSENDPVDHSPTGPEASVTENTLAETAETAGDPPDRRQIGAFTTSSGSVPGAGDRLRSDTAEINLYDRLPYPNYSHRESHPRKLEAIATLFGMKPPPSNACRVLELGCASGWNLIPQAQDLPFSRFLGIDSSVRQIENARNMAEELDLQNIELRHADILEVDRDWGQFDYIICHGIYSWVPKEVREKLLEICSGNLVSNGVALVSYNTYPGWSTRGMVRDMMRYHVAGREDPHEQVTQARAVLKFLAENCPEDTPHAKALENELAALSDKSDSQIFHDHLELVNHPVYFHQFVEQAGANNLQYLGDVNFHQMVSGFLSKDAKALLAGVPLLQQEQYMDYLNNRLFRRSLLCHADVKLERNLQPRIIYGFHVAQTQPLDLKLLDPNEEKPVGFKIGKHKLMINGPLVKAAIWRLSEVWPESLLFEDLHTQALDMLQPGQRELYEESQKSEAGDSRSELSLALMAFMSAGLMECFVHPPRPLRRPGEHPVASPVARCQARDGVKVTNSRHELVTLTDTEHHIIKSLDGSHDRQALASSLGDALASGAMRVMQDGEALDEVDPKMLSDIVERSLHRLYRGALLVE